MVLSSTTTIFKNTMQKFLSLQIKIFSNMYLNAHMKKKML